MVHGHNTGRIAWKIYSPHHLFTPFHFYWFSSEILDLWCYVRGPYILVIEIRETRLREYRVPPMSAMWWSWVPYLPPYVLHQYPLKYLEDKKYFLWNYCTPGYLTRTVPVPYFRAQTSFFQRTDPKKIVSRAGTFRSPHKYYQLHKYDLIYCTPCSIYNIELCEGGCNQTNRTRPQDRHGTALLWYRWEWQSAISLVECNLTMKIFSGCLSKLTKTWITDCKYSSWWRFEFGNQ